MSLLHTITASQAKRAFVTILITMLTEINKQTSELIHTRQQTVLCYVYIGVETIINSYRFLFIIDIFIRVMSDIMFITKRDKMNKTLYCVVTNQ